MENEVAARMEHAGPGFNLSSQLQWRYLKSHICSGPEKKAKQSRFTNGHGSPSPSPNNMNEGQHTKERGGRGRRYHVLRRERGRISIQDAVKTLRDMRPSEQTHPYWKTPSSVILRMPRSSNAWPANSRTLSVFRHLLADLTSDVWL